MQKFYSILLGSMILCLGCSQIIDENGIMDSSIEITGESVMKKFYTKNLSNAFSDFIKNPEENTCRTAVSSNTEDFFFENMWEDLNEEEKQLFLENVDNINVSKDSIISVKNGTSMGRAILNGDTSEIDSIAALYSYDEWLADIFGDEIINFSFKGIESSEIEEKVPVHLVINYLSKTKNGMK